MKIPGRGPVWNMKKFVWVILYGVLSARYLASRDWHFRDLIIVLRKNRDIGEDILEKKKGKGSFIFVVAIFLCGCFFLLPLEMRDIKYSLFLLGVLPIIVAFYCLIFYSDSKDNTIRRRIYWVMVLMMLLMIPVFFLMYLYGLITFSALFQTSIFCALGCLLPLAEIRDIPKKNGWVKK